MSYSIFNRPFFSEAQNQVLRMYLDLFCEGKGEEGKIHAGTINVDRDLRTFLICLLSVEEEIDAKREASKMSPRQSINVREQIEAGKRLGLTQDESEEFFVTMFNKSDRESLTVGWPEDRKMKVLQLRFYLERIARLGLTFGVYESHPESVGYTFGGGKG